MQFYSCLKIHIFESSHHEMSTQKEVTSFLKDFNDKMTLWGVLFREDRSKNAQALLELELRPKDRESILLDLKPQDYVDGPRADTLYGGADLWIFGKIVKEKEVSFKITHHEKSHHRQGNEFGQGAS